MFPVLTSFGLDKLTIPERMRLVDELWDSIASEQDQVLVTEEQQQDLDRRLAAIEADPSRGSTWDVVKARLMSGS